MLDHLAFDVEVYGNSVILRGDLTDATDSYVKLNNALSPFGSRGASVIEIDATRACLLKGGVKMWTSVVNDCLWQHELHYNRASWVWPCSTMRATGINGLFFQRKTRIISSEGFWAILQPDAFS